MKKAVYLVIKWFVKLFYPKTEAMGTENLPGEACIIVGNHTQLHGPIVCELYFPKKRYTWCNGEMMHLKEVPSYAFSDFWSEKPKSVRWFYKILSYIIAPLSVCIFSSANTIGVYRDQRIISTFKETVAKLNEGSSIVVFPESEIPLNNIINDFHDKFIDVAKLYYKRTKKELCFVPMYVAPALKKFYFGKPIRFCAENPMEEERRRICEHLMKEITEIGRSLPKHRVVPFKNISKKDYPMNI